MPKARRNTAAPPAFNPRSGSGNSSKTCRLGAPSRQAAGKGDHPDMHSLFYIIGVVVVALLVINLIS